MSISDTNKARQYASIAEVAAAQAKLFADKLDSAPDYASQAAASAADAAQSATVAVAAESIVNNYVIAASDYASDAAQSAITAGSAAESAISQTLRVPTGEAIESLPLAEDRAETLISFDSAGETELVGLNTFARLDQDGKVPVANIPAIALTEPFVVSSQEQMLSLDAQVGDIAKRTDKGLSFVLGALPASSLDNWIQLNDDILSQLALSSGAAQVGALDDSGGTITVQGALALKPSSSYLASAAGSSAVGYAGGATPSSLDPGASVQSAINRLTEKVVYAVKYGVKADGVTDDTAAIQSLSAAVSAMTHPVVRVVFPQGISMVGAQQQAPNATSGYSFRPTYMNTGNNGWFYVSGRAGKTIIDATGWTIKLNPGMKHGAFDPLTGSAITTTLPFRDTNYMAWAGMLVAFKNCEHIIRYGLNVDGGASTAVWGGKYGDSGWQCASFGIWDTGCKRIEAYNDNSTNALLDNLYVSTESNWAPSATDTQRTADYYNCLYTDGRRQNVTISGGQNIRFHGGQAIRSGRKCLGAGSSYSAPEANVDIESESGAAYDIVFDDFQMVDGGLYTFVAASFINSFSRATLNRCTLRTNSTIAQIYTTGSGIKFSGCLIEGSGFESRNASQTETSFKGCVIRNHIDGVVASFCSYSGNVGSMEDNYFDIIFDAKMGSRAIFALTGGDITATPVYPQKGVFRFNRINLSGNQDAVAVAANGRTSLGYIQFFFDMDIRITATSLTGARLVDINATGSNVNQRGITVDNNKVVDRDSGTSSLMAAGGYMIARSMEVAANSLVPSVSGMSIGSATRRLGNIYLGQNGIYIIDAGGTARLITVNAAGALVVTAA